MTHGPTERIARSVYRWVSQNRTRLPGGTPACALPPAPDEPPTDPKSPAPNDPPTPPVEREQIAGN